MIYAGFLLTLVGARVLVDLARDDPVVPDPSNAGTLSAEYSFYLKTEKDIEAAEVLVVEFPSEFLDIGILGYCWLNSIAQSCVKEGARTVRVTLGTPIPMHHRQELKISGIDNPVAAAGTSYFKLRLEHSVSGQVIERNDAFGTVGFAPAATGVPGTVQFTDSVVGVGGPATFKFLLSSGVEQYSKFRISITAPFSVSASYSCASVAYSGSVPAVAGNFMCSIGGERLVVTGLTADLPAGQGVAFTISDLVNPGYAYAAGATSFIVDVVRPETTVIVGKFTFSSPEITVGRVTEVAISAYSADSRFSMNNELYTLLMFTVETGVPAGGNIIIDYGVAANACFIHSGLTTASCSSSGTEVTVTLSSSVGAGTKVEVASSLAFGTTGITTVSVRTLDALGRDIDQDDGASGGLSLETYSAFTVDSITYEGKALGAGYVAVAFTPNNDIATGATVDLYMPSGFSINDAPVCTVDISGSPETVTCSVANQRVRVTIGTAQITSASGGVITIDSANGVNYPSKGSSLNNPLEWNIRILHTDSSVEFSSATAELGTGEFTMASTATQVEHLGVKDAWGPMTFNLKIDSVLGLNSRIVIEFPTSDGASNGFPADLGTGLTGSFPLHSTTLQNYSAELTVECSLTPASAVSATDFAVLEITGFAEIQPGEVITFVVFIKGSEAAAATDLKLRTEETDLNGVTTKLQEGVTTLSFAPAANWGSSSYDSISSTTVNAEVTIQLTLQTSSADTTPSEQLLIVLPSFFGFSEEFTVTLAGTVLNDYMIYENAYAPALVITLDNAQLLSSAAKTVQVTGLVNGPYAGTAAGDIYAGLIQSIGTLQDYQSIGTVTGVVESALALELEASSYKKASPDVLYKFMVTTTHTVPPTGKVLVSFPPGFDVSYTICSYSVELAGDLMCSASGQDVTITGFSSISAGSSFYVKIWNVINPDQDASGAFVVATHYDASMNSAIEAGTDTGFDLGDAQSPGESYIYSIDFFPKNSGLVGDMTLEFNLAGSVPSGGEITVEFPVAYTLPSLGPSNCLLSHIYASCTASGSRLTLVSHEDFAAELKLTLRILDMPVATSAAASSAIQIASEWQGHVMSVTPSTPGSTFYYTPSSSVASSLSATVVVHPLNACERSTYEFSILALFGLSDGWDLYIRFPEEYPGYMGDVRCWSSSAKRDDGLLQVEVSESRRFLIINGFKNIATGASFVVTVENAMNPEATGITSAFFIGTMNANAVVEYSDTLTVSISAIPSIMQNVMLQLSDYSIKEFATYNFVLEATSFSGPAEIWIAYPDADYEFELYGTGAEYTCDVKHKSKTDGSETAFITNSVTCANPQRNLLVVKIPDGSYSSTHYLNVQVSGVKSPQLAGSTSDYVTSVYIPNSKLVTQRTYGTASGKMTADFIEEKQEVYVIDLFGKIALAPGIMQEFKVFTASEKIRAKADLLFTPFIHSRISPIPIEIWPEKIILPKGESSASFYIKCPIGTLDGDYIITWTVSEDTKDDYLQPKDTLLRIDSSLLFSLTFDSIYHVMQGQTSIPLYVRLEAAPADDIHLNVTVTEGIGVTGIQFGEGQFVAEYTISINETFQPGTYQLEFEIQGNNSAAYYSTVYTEDVFVIDHDSTIPAVSAFLVHTPKQRLYLDMSFQATEACLFYYTYGDRGLLPPELGDLVVQSLNMTEAFYTGYIGDSFNYDFIFSGLHAESDYILYGVLADFNGNTMSELFSINLYTAEMYDSAIFTLEFMGSLPDEDALNTTVIEALAEQFVVNETRLELYEVSAGALQSFILYNDPYSDLPSPTEMIEYTAIPSEINKRLSSSGFSINKDYNIQSSLRIINNRRPEWLTFPILDSTYSSELNITMVVTTTGRVFTEILEDEDIVPSSRQITQGLDAFNAEPKYWYSHDVEAGESLTVSYSGLVSATHYTVVITAINNDERLPRYMNDDFVARLDIITQTEGSSVLTVNGSLLTSLSLSLLLIFIS